MSNLNNLLNIIFEVGKGIPITLAYTIVAWFFGILLACLFVWIKTIKAPGCFLVDILISILRGTPVLVQVMFFYYCLPIQMPAFLAASLAFIFNSAAYTSEILRGGIASINKGQFLACKTLGIPSSKAWLDIFIPQVLRICIPSLVSEFTTLVKETAILSFIGEQDIMKHASDLGASTYSYLTPLLVAGCFYYLICNSIMFISKYLEQRMNKHV